MRSLGREITAGGLFLVRLQASSQQLYDKLSYLVVGFQELCLDFFRNYAETFSTKVLNSLFRFF